MKTIRTLTLTLLFVGAVSAGVWFGAVRDVYAIPLVGGRSTITSICTNGGIMITVAGPRPGVFMVKLVGTRIYAYAQFASSWVVGDSTPGGICKVGKIPIPVLGTVRLIGTSAA